MPDYQAYHELNYGCKEVVDSQVKLALEFKEKNARGFGRFFALWAAFNAWGACVTSAESDAKMIAALGGCPQASVRFDNMIRLNSDLVEAIEEIQNSFPLPSFADLIKLDRTYWWMGERGAEFWEKIAIANADKRRVRLSPKLDSKNLSWSDALQCMYMVRCNLFHGGKRAIDTEERFVGVFSDILEQLLSNGPNCLLGIGNTMQI